MNFTNNDVLNISVIGTIAKTQNNSKNVREKQDKSITSFSKKEINSKEKKLEKKEKIKNVLFYKKN